jgi:hypothetical protein
VTGGISQKQKVILGVQQLGNDQNLWDQNDNTDDFWTYENTNPP